jgi:GDP-4-dehydro-6-deoxy-D-mannose reductase
LTPTSSACASANEAFVKVLVTGADGFVGRHLVARLLEAGHQVSAACRPGGEPPARWLGPQWRQGVQVVPFEVTDPASIRAALRDPCEAIVHLAAVATVREARQDPGHAWVVNAAGTARLLDAVIEARARDGGDPKILVVSSAEVYGSGPPSPRVETDPLCPQSSYAASKAAGEIAALEAWRRAGVRAVIARPFQHTGPQQALQYVVPSFVHRLAAAKASGSTRVPTGNLEPIRDLLDVRDVIEAYLGLLTQGVAGQVYNIARGEGVTLRELFDQLADLIGLRAEPVPDPALIRTGDIPYLVGDPNKLCRATGWSPKITLDQTLREVVDAQAH